MEGAIAVLAQFLESNLEHVSNKSAYLCGVMKTYRQKSRAAGHAQVRLYLVTDLRGWCRFRMFRLVTLPSRVPTDKFTL